MADPANPYDALTPDAPATPGAPVVAKPPPAPTATTGTANPYDALPVTPPTPPSNYDWFEKYVRPIHLPNWVPLPSLTSNIPVTDSSGNLQPVDPHNSADESRNFVVRAGLRAAPITAWPNAAIVAGQVGVDALSRKLGITDPNAPPVQPFNPIESFIDKAGIGQDPNASQAMKTADSLAPWVVPGANTVARVAESPGIIGKGAALAGSTLMSGADWAASNAASDWAKRNGYSPLVQTIVGAGAPLVRGGVFRTIGGAANKIGGSKEGTEWYDYSKQEGETPALSDVVSPAVQEFQKKAASLSSLPTLRNLSQIGASLGGAHGGLIGAATGIAGGILPRLADDPSIVRAFAGRGLTTPLMQQYATRAALGANDAQVAPPPFPITQAVMNYFRPGG